MNKLKTLSIILATLTLVTACVDSEKGKLDNRVLDFWNFKINRDFENAYKFLSPGWRDNESKDAYSLRMGVAKIKWLKAKVIEKNCKKNDVCRVKVGIDYEYKFKTVADKMKVSSYIYENWIMIENTWYNLPIETK